MKVAIIGTGRVGGTLALLLVSNSKIDKLLLINRTRETSEGMKLSLMGTCPESAPRIFVGEYRDAEEGDIIFITCGVFGVPEGTRLFDVNKKMIEEVFNGWKPKKHAKIVVITTPVDEIALAVLKVSGLDSKNVIGFGGQLDVNRLKYLIYKDTGRLPKNVHFVGVHGAAGIPIFRDKVQNRNQIIEDSKNYFKKYLSKLKRSTHSTSAELAKLFEALSKEEETVLDISYFDKDKKLFITWPCEVNREGIEGQLKINLSKKEHDELEKLIATRSNAHA